MASLVVASDASPLAAISATPRREQVGGVACDALLEGEQSGPLSGNAYAATTMGVLGLGLPACTTRDEQTGAYDCKKDGEGIGSGMHAG